MSKPNEPNYVSPFRRTHVGQIDPQVLDELISDLVELSEKYGNRHFRGRRIVVSLFEKLLSELIRIQHN